MMKTFANRIEALMRRDAVTTLPHMCLYVFSLVYGVGVRLRLFLYSAGILKAHRLPCRVVSIGNITVGGTGKTPVAMLVAEFIAASGAKVVILSRGYKRRSKGLVVVSDYASVLATAEEAGDEPFLMARRLAGVPVVVSSDRVGAGRLICERFKPDYIILDDGFQHLRLFRDVNIMLVDGLVGFGNGHLLPAGILREPVSGAARADAVMVKDGRRGRGVADALHTMRFEPLSLTYRPGALTDVRDARQVDGGVDMLKHRKVFAIAGIANPASFFDSIEKLGLKVIGTLVFPDHHWFTHDDIKAIMTAAVRAGADAIVTTEKDGVRLAPILSRVSNSLPVYALHIAAACDEEALRRLIFTEKD
ncbi:MAG: tetraacyldisaccharide 4'-kinase [Deltaproteobacteria bacterium]|nr:tetraacyldisaccharide 4'-kinase [Deltaproteobacteria bacterium]